jgi:hypothetical protein
MFQNMPKCGLFAYQTLSNAIKLRQTAANCGKLAASEAKSLLSCGQVGSSWRIYKLTLKR